jgi:hypothetical protein
LLEVCGCSNSVNAYARPHVAWYVKAY